MGKGRAGRRHGSLRGFNLESPLTFTSTNSAKGSGTVTGEKLLGGQLASRGGNRAKKSQKPGLEAPSPSNPIYRADASPSRAPTCSTTTRGLRRVILRARTSWRCSNSSSEECWSSSKTSHLGNLLFPASSMWWAEGRSVLGRHPGALPPLGAFTSCSP